MTRAVVLVDGEHYPPVTLDAIATIAERFDVAAAVFLGGTEKIGATIELGGLDIVTGPTQRAALEAAIDGYSPSVVFDLSDAPVVDTHARFLLASVALARGVSYRGADFSFDPPARPRLSSRPSIAVIGTGKRTGKTAVSSALARHASARGLKTVVVAMGRGGPAEPVVTRGDSRPPSADELIALAERGEHAASDSYEDAVVARVTTVGARRAGGGLAGGTVYDTVARAVEVAEHEKPDLLILEGSGTAIPPAHADATLLVVGSATPAMDLRAGLAAYRLLISHGAVVTMAEEPILASETLDAFSNLLQELSPNVPVVRTVFRAQPLEPVAGRKVFVATTAPEVAGPALLSHLQTVHGATVVGSTHQLADRTKLSEDLFKAEGTYEVLLTELKAAAIDVAARTARASGADVVFMDNVPVATQGDDLEALFDLLIDRVLS